MKQKIIFFNVWRHRGRRGEGRILWQCVTRGGGGGGGQKVTKFAWRHFWTAPNRWHKKMRKGRTCSDKLVFRMDNFRTSTWRKIDKCIVSTCFERWHWKKRNLKWKYSKFVWFRLLRDKRCANSRFIEFVEDMKLVDGKYEVRLPFKENKPLLEG